MNSEKSKQLLYQMATDLSGAQSAYNDIVEEVEAWEAEIKGVYIKPSQAMGLGPQASRDESGLMMRDLKRIVEGSIPSISEPFLSGSDIVGVTPRDAKSVERADKLEELLNKQFNKGTNRVRLIEGLARDIQEQGTVFIKSGWGDNMPVVEQVNFKEIIIDPSARSLQAAKFVIQRRKLSISDILANPGWFGKHTLDSLSQLSGVVDTEYDSDANEGFGQDTNYNYSDRAREMVEIFEYYGVLDIEGNGVLTPVLGIWNEDLLLRFTESPYPDSWNGNPFDSAVYTSRSFNVYGDGIAPLVGDYQKVRTGFMREIMNNANKANQTQIASRKGSIDVANKRKMMNGEDYEYLGAEPGIIKGEFNQVPPSVFQILEQFKIEEEELSGISRQNAGVDGIAGSAHTATAVSIAQSNADKRLQQIVRHMQDMFESMFTKWIDLNVMMLRNGVVKNKVAMNRPELYTQLGMNQPDMVPVNGMELNGKYDLIIQVGTAEQKRIQNQNILMMMQQVQMQANVISPSVSLALLAQLAGNMDMAGLSSQLSATANSVVEQEKSGQPSEQEQIAKETAMLEMEKLNSEIDENNASAAKDQASAAGTHTETVLATYGVNATIN